MTLQLRPTFSESWYRVQHLKPKLRAGAQISRQFYRGDRWYVVRDPAGNQYHRLSDAAYKFVGLLDGKRTVGEAWELVGGQLADDSPTQPEVIQILSQLYAANLIETNIPPDATILLRRHKKQMSQKAKGRLMNLLFPRIPLWDPDWFLKMWLPVLKPLLSLPGFLVWLGLIVFTCVTLAPYWTQLTAQGWETINFAQNPANAVWLYLSFIVLKIIHEMGHGFICRRFGGEVHELGVMFLVLFPAPYVDASSAWGFPNKWHRFLVGAGGIIFEIVVACGAAFVWLWTMNTGDPVGMWVHMMAYNVMLIASVSTLVFNANPLLRYDGYYMLSDWLEIPNLQMRSREYALYLIKRYLFRVKWSQPLPPPNHRPWLLLYNYTSGPYRIFIGVAIMLMVLYHLPQELKIIGMFLFLGSLLTFIGMPLYKSLKYLLVEPELHRKRVLAWTWTGGFIAVLVVLIGFVQWPFWIRGEGVLMPERAEIRAQEEGLVESIDVEDGQLVRAGEVLLVARNTQLESQLAEARAQLAQLEIQFRASQRDDPAIARQAAIRMRAIGEAVAALEHRQNLLTVRAPRDGIVVAPNLHRLADTWISPSKTREEPLAVISNPQTLYVQTLIDQKDYQTLTAAVTAEGRRRWTTQVRLATDVTRDIAPEDITDIRLAQGSTDVAPSPSLGQAAGGNQTIDPADPSGRKLQQEQFEVRLTLANPHGLYIPGQRAHVRILYEENRTLWWQGWRYVQQLIMTTRTS